MYIAMFSNYCGKGSTVEEAYHDLVNEYGYFDGGVDATTFYEAQEVKVKQKLEVVEEKI